MINEIDKLYPEEGMIGSQTTDMPRQKEEEIMSE
jgi:hypothetical protein